MRPLPALPAPQVNGRYIKKRIHVRIEHVTPSRCHEEFLRRCKENDAARHEAKVAGTAPPVLKRQPKGPRTEGFTLENVKMETITREPCRAPHPPLRCSRLRARGITWGAYAVCSLGYSRRLHSCRSPPLLFRSSLSKRHGASASVVARADAGVCVPT